MVILKAHRLFAILLALLISVSAISSFAQEQFPEDNGLCWADYHKGPDYRQSESHPLRIVGYILHPVGWVLREVIFRPFSWLASSSEETASVMGYREPRDFRDSSCFDDSGEIPNCRSIAPYNYVDKKKK
jgi:hypothetical protein